MIKTGSIAISEEQFIDELHQDWYKQKIQAQENEKEKKPEFRTFYELGEGCFAEEVIEGEIARFVTWDGKQFQYFDSDKLADGTPILPINDEAIEKGAVLLQEKPEPFNSLEELTQEIQQHIRKYLDVSEDYVIFATYYILLTWVYDRLTTLPYLRALGDTGTGKSRFLNVIGRLCYKPCIVSGCITPAPIYRMIDRWKGTIILDEADFRDSNEKNEVITILNCGFERGRPVIRCNPNDVTELQFLPTFSPKVFSTRYSFKDVALESRCLTEKMRQSNRQDIPAILPTEFYGREKEIRNKLLYFRFIYRDKINPDDIQTIDLGDIEPRLKQATASFAVLFANIPDLFDKFKDFLQSYQKELIEERSNTLEGHIVACIDELVDEAVSSESSVSNVSGGHVSERLESLHGIKASPQTVGKYLKSLGLKTHFKRTMEGGRRFLDLSDKELWETLKRRYIPNYVSSVKPSYILDTNDTLDTKSEEKAIV